MGGGHGGRSCPVLQALAAGPGESYSEVARGVMGRLAHGLPREPCDCTGKCTGLSHSSEPSCHSAPIGLIGDFFFLQPGRLMSAFGGARGGCRRPSPSTQQDRSCQPSVVLAPVACSGGLAAGTALTGARRTSVDVRSRLKDLRIGVQSVYWCRADEVSRQTPCFWD